MRFHAAWAISWTIPDSVQAEGIWTLSPPPPLHSKRPCIVSGVGEGTVIFRFANLLRRSDIELLLWLEKGIVGAFFCSSDFWHPRHSTAPCIMQNTSVFRNFSPWMLILLTLTQLVLLSTSNVVNFQCSGGSSVPAKILAPQSTVLIT